MDFPILCPPDIIQDYLLEDSNKKYIQFAKGKFDAEVERACKES
jgi:hypothetical protein